MLNYSEVTYNDYRQLFPKPSVVYNSVDFALLNASKTGLLHFLVLNNDHGKPLFGIIIGENAEGFSSPFSAPFGGLETNRSHGVETWLEAAEALKSFAREFKKPLRIALPPAFYCSDDRIEAQALALKTAGFTDTPDYNYHFNLDVPQLTSAARNKLATAGRHDFKTELTTDVARSYAVIKTNRDQRGYPLRMTLGQVEETVKLIPADFWIMSLEGRDVAAAQIFEVNDRVVQVVYWGEDTEFSPLRPMNLLASKIALHYLEKGKIVDVGPSSTDGVPSTGLCDFKASVGCHLTPKHVLTLSV